MTPNELDAQLSYLADSPQREHGGFHPQVVETAKAAITELARLRERVRGLECDYRELLRNQKPPLSNRKKRLKAIIREQAKAAKKKGKVGK